MSRLGSAARAAIALLACIGFAGALGAGSAPATLAVEVAPDESEVVLVLDFSASILNDATNRNRFAAALEGMADRVEATSADLVAGAATVTIVRFATRAADYTNCVELKLLDDPEAVDQFAACLRSVAAAYRRGLDAALTRAIGIDTNYVEAMERAAAHLPADAVRPTLILFTDGKHDVAGVPLGQVPTTHDRLFGDRSPFALLPVGMGLDPAERDALTDGLEGLQVIRDMPPCVSGTVFDWPQVVFESPAEAGNAVAVALQAATCTFTVAPTEPPASPTPTPVPEPGAVRDIELTPGDGRIDIAWTPPAEAVEAVQDYRARCSDDGASWIESTEGASLEPRATVDGLTAGIEYRCEVAAVTATTDDAWTAAAATAVPIGIPAAPARPAVQPLDGGLQVAIDPPAGDDVTDVRFECSVEGAASWDQVVDIPSGAETSARIRDLTNGTPYVCRAFALNAAGVSAASPLSDVVRPCSSFLDCNPLAAPVLGGIVLAALLGILVGLFLLYRERNQGYVLAVLDVAHTANLGRGSTLGIALVRDPATKRVTGIVAERGPAADFRIRPLRGGRFAVTDRTARREIDSGDSLIVADSHGVRHELVLRAFSTKAASAVTSRR